MRICYCHSVILCVAVTQLVGCAARAVVEDDTEADASNTSPGSPAYGCAQASCDGASIDVEVIASDQLVPFGIATDDDFVYWANDADYPIPSDDEGAVMRASISSGLITALAEEASSPISVAISGSNVYWVTQQTVAKAPKQGGQSKILFSDGVNLISITADDEHVYAADTQTDDIIRIDVATDDITVFQKDVASPFEIANDETHLYWTADVGLLMASKKDMVPVHVFEALWDKGVYLTDVAADESGIYCTQWAATGSCDGEGTIVALEKDGSMPKNIAVDVITHGARIVLDQGYVYWSEPESGRIMKLSKNGGEPTVIACGQNMPLGISLDSTHVYWTNAAGGTVMRAPK